MSRDNSGSASGKFILGIVAFIFAAIGVLLFLAVISEARDDYMYTRENNYSCVSGYAEKLAGSFEDDDLFSEDKDLYMVYATIENRSVKVAYEDRFSVGFSTEDGASCRHRLYSRAVDADGERLSGRFGLGSIIPSGRSAIVKFIVSVPKGADKVDMVVYNGDFEEEPISIAL